MVGYYSLKFLFFIKVISAFENGHLEKNWGPMLEPVIKEFVQYQSML